MNTQSLLSKLNSIFSKNKHIVAAYMIGSFAIGTIRKESDFDIVIVVENRRLLNLEKVYSSIRHLSFPKDLDVSIIDRNSSPLFLYQIVSHGKRIYERSEKEVADFEADALHIYYDTNHMRNIYYSYLKSKFA